MSGSIYSWEYHKADSVPFVSTFFFFFLQRLINSKKKIFSYCSVSIHSLKVVSNLKFWNKLSDPCVLQTCQNNYVSIIITLFWILARWILKMAFWLEVFFFFSLVSFTPQGLKDLLVFCIFPIFSPSKSSLNLFWKSLFTENGISFLVHTDL